MSRKRNSLATLARLAITLGALSIGQTAVADSYVLSASGWDAATAVDRNEDGQAVWRTTAFGKGKFGKSVTHTTRESEFVGFGTGCGGLPADVFALKLRTLAHSVVTRYENGDLLFAALDTNASENFVCIGLSSLGNWYGGRMIVIGGTGRFDGATGWYNMSAMLTPLPEQTGEFSQNGAQLELNGEVFLTRNDRSDDGDDEDDD